MAEELKKEIMKWFKADFIFHISGSPWVSPIHVMAKKSGKMLKKNEKCEEVETQVASSKRVCIDFQKLNFMTKKYQ